MIQLEGEGHLIPRLPSRPLQEMKPELLLGGVLVPEVVEGPLDDHPDAVPPVPVELLPDREEVALRPLVGVVQVELHQPL